MPRKEPLERHDKEEKDEHDTKWSEGFEGPRPIQSSREAGPREEHDGQRGGGLGLGILRLALGSGLDLRGQGVEQPPVDLRQPQPVVHT